MSSCWKINRYIVCCATIVVVASSSIYAQAPESQYNLKRRPQMKVIEVTPQTSGINHFTVVGAVHRSGVFTSHKHRIPLSDLIKAAWGLTDSARSSIRVIRGGQDRFRLLYEPEKATQQFVQANDVVVVLPKAGVQTISASSPVIPVACIGLDQRPIVLALTPDIRTVNDLLINLKQPAQVQSTVKIMDPFGRGKTLNLAPGSVIFFDAATVDRTPFDSPESFPPTASLEESSPKFDKNISEFGIPKITPGIAPDSLPTEQSPSVTLPSASGQPRSQPLFSNVAVESQLPDATPPLHEPPKVSSRNLFSANPIGIVSPPGNSQRTPKSHGTEFDQQPEIDLPLLNDQATTPGSENDSLANHQLPSIAPAPPGPTENGPINTRRNELLSATLSTAIKQSHEGSSEFKQEESNPKNLTKLTQQVSTIPAAKVDTRSTGNSILPIALGVAFLGILCLVGAILWSRHDRNVEKHQVRVTAKQKTEEKLADSDTDNSQLAFIINRSTPIIEEEVILPTETPIHGEPVGQRRIIVQERHEKISGPHFVRNSRSTKKSKSIASSSPNSPEESGSNIVYPVKEIVNGLYDVVEPDSKVSPSQPSNGALERALVALAAEKKQ